MSYLLVFNDTLLALWRIVFDFKGASAAHDDKLSTAKKMVFDKAELKCENHCCNIFSI